MHVLLSTHTHPGLEVGPEEAHGLSVQVQEAKVGLEAHGAEAERQGGQAARGCVAQRVGAVLAHAHQQRAQQRLRGLQRQARQRRHQVTHLRMG